MLNTYNKEMIIKFLPFIPSPCGNPTKGRYGCIVVYPETNEELAEIAEITDSEEQK